MTPLQHLETTAIHALVWLSRALGPVRASDFGGFLARSIGPLLPVSRVARCNLAMALPELDAPTRRRILHDAWDNLGRTVAELPHLARLGPTASGPGWEIDGEARLGPLLLPGGRGIMFSGHLGNWEMLFVAAPHYGLRLAALYRAAANPGIDRLLMGLRSPPGQAAGPMFAKGATGARGALTYLRQGGGTLSFLMDQKMNDGIEATLFGHPAMTAPALASMALRFRCPVVPACVVRLGPARFRLLIAPPLELPDSGDRTADIRSLTQAVNTVLESWIRARPGEWLWMHRRWPKAIYAAGEGRA